MKKAISILGPTHCGKTELAIEINNRFPSKIISVDSVQLYKDANIGSSKPDQKILDKNYHALINVLEVEEEFSVKKFLDEVAKELSDENQNFLFVGGSMMYFYSLFKGISKLPEKNELLREEISKEAEKLGWKQMHQRLSTVDPISAENIEPNDTQRILRALEVNKLSKASFATLKQQKEKSLIDNFDKISIAIIPRCKKIFKEKLKERFEKMIDQGLIEETKDILKKTNGRRIKVLETVGYKQVVEYIDNKVSQEEMIELATNATYQLAKRQITWLKKFNLDKTFFSDEDDKVMKILSMIKN